VDHLKLEQVEPEFEDVVVAILEASQQERSA